MSKSDQQLRDEAEARILADHLEDLKRHNLIPNPDSPITKLIQDRITSLRVASGDTPADEADPFEQAGREQEPDPVPEYSAPTNQQESIAAQDPPLLPTQAAQTPQPTPESIPTQAASATQVVFEPEITQAALELQPTNEQPPTAQVQSPQQITEPTSVQPAQAPQQDTKFEFNAQTPIGDTEFDESGLLEPRSQQSMEPQSPWRAMDPEFKTAKPDAQQPQGDKASAPKREKSDSRIRFEKYRDKIREDYEKGKVSQDGPPIQGEFLQAWRDSIASIKMPKPIPNALGGASTTFNNASGQISFADGRTELESSTDEAAASLVSVISTLAQLSIDLSNRLKSIERTIEEASV